MDSVQAEILRRDLMGVDLEGWIIDGYHGHGKSAVVMAAGRAGERAAIKVFHPELVERFGRETQLERIRRETSLIGAKHPNLVEILGGGESNDGEWLFVAMEELPWKNLKDRLNDVPVSNYWRLVTQLAAAAKYLEERGLAHRDIKPENIAISDDFATLKLLDLGVLRPFGVAGLTDMDARVFIGTLRYSSPEFLKREELDSLEGWRALTFYQIGAVIHDLLMKKEIFAEHSEPFAVLVEAVQQHHPEVTGEDLELVRLCKNCLVKDPSTRGQIVEWSNFNQQPLVDGRENLFRKIRARQRFYEQDSAVFGGIKGEEDRLLRIELIQASSTLDYRLGRLLTTLKCFPLHSITPSVDFGQRAVSSDICFLQDETLGLNCHLSMRFLLSVIGCDAGRSIFSLEASASIDGEVVTGKVTIGNGSLTDACSDPEVEAWMLSTLGRCYDLIEKQNFTA